MPPPPPLPSSILIILVTIITINNNSSVTGIIPVAYNVKAHHDCIFVLLSLPLFVVVVVVVVCVCVIFSIIILAFDRGDNRRVVVTTHGHRLDGKCDHRHQFWPKQQHLPQRRYPNKYSIRV